MESFKDKGSKEKQIFESYSVPKAVASLAVPTVISQIVTIIYNFADTWYVGRTDNAAAVAALAVSMPVFIIINALANLFGIGGAGAISRSLGAGKPERARKVFAFSLWGGITAALLYSLLVLIFRNKIIVIIGGDVESFEYIKSYMLWTMIIGALPTMLNALFAHLVRSVGAARQASVGMSLGAALNIALDPLFMFVLLPKGMEVTGAAIATMVSNLIACLYFIIFFIRHRDNPVFTLNPRELSFTDKVPYDVLSVGLPAALSTTLAMVSNIVANKLVVGYGNAAVAGLGVAKKINTLAFNINMGLTQGVLPLVGYNFASGNHKRMKQSVYFTGLCSLIFSLSCLALYTAFSSRLVGFFIDEQQTVAYGARFLFVIAFAVPLCSLTYSVNTVFQATGKRIFSFILSVLRKGVLDIPLMFVFRRFMGVTGIVWATPVAETLSVILALILFFSFMKKLSSGEVSAEKPLQQ